MDAAIRSTLLLLPLLLLAGVGADSITSRRAVLPKPKLGLRTSRDEREGVSAANSVDKGLSRCRFLVMLVAITVLPEEGAGLGSAMEELNEESAERERTGAGVAAMRRALAS